MRVERSVQRQSEHVQLCMKSSSHIDLLLDNLAQTWKIESACPSASISISEFVDKILHLNWVLFTSMLKTWLLRVHGIYRVLT